MLANTHTTACSGALNEDIHLPFESLYRLLDFIKDELPLWRDRSERNKEESETLLTSQICAHLNSASRRSGGWDFLQFRTEEPDVQCKGRKIDLVPAPSNATVWIEGRRHYDFDSLLPIECKRLPTPKGKNRDEREYVISGYSSTGGIQRFKAGHHGAAYKLGAMIGYVQKETRAFWDTKISEWINALNTEPGWTEKDLLHLKNSDDALKVSVLRSTHERVGSLPEIELQHLWIEIN